MRGEGGVPARMHPVLSALRPARFVVQREKFAVPSHPASEQAPAAPGV